MRTKSGPGRLQARARDTRRTILDSAVTLYLSQGAENTTVSAIIKRARLGRTTFYRYFKDADDVLNQAVIRDFRGLMADFETQGYEQASLEEQIRRGHHMVRSPVAPSTGLEAALREQQPTALRAYRRVACRLFQRGNGMLAPNVRAGSANGAFAGRHHAPQVRGMVHVHRNVVADGQLSFRGQ